MSKKVSVLKNLLSAAAEGDLSRLKGLVEAHGGVGLVVEGMTALTQACRFGQLEVAQWLIAAGADVNQSNKLMEPALHNAVRSRNIGLVRLLLAEGADPNLRSEAYGEVALTLAIGSQESEISVLLLRAGADFALAHPMSLAKLSGSEVVEAITKQPLWFRRSAPNGVTFLHAMAFFGGAAYIERAIAAGLDVLRFERSSYGKNLLEMAMSGGCSEVEALLRQQFAEAAVC